MVRLVPQERMQRIVKQMEEVPFQRIWWRWVEEFKNCATAAICRGFVDRAWTSPFHEWMSRNQCNDGTPGIRGVYKFSKTVTLVLLAGLIR